MLTLGRLCRQVGLARASVLHYEAIGLLAASQRSTAGYRLYSDADVQRLLKIRQYRNAGLSLTEVGQLLAAQDQSAAPQGQGQTSPARPSAKSQPEHATQLLEQRLTALSTMIEQLRGQQRAITRLLASDPLHRAPEQIGKAGWVAMLRDIGLDDTAMLAWHAAFESDDPARHRQFLQRLGMGEQEVQDLMARLVAVPGARS